MNKGKLIVANWKMNFLYKNAFNFCKNLLLKKKAINNSFIICPSSVLISQLASKFKNIIFGAQDCHFEKGLIQIFYFFRQINRLVAQINLMWLTKVGYNRNKKNK